VILGSRVTVVGASGTGKTTFARALAAAIGAPHVELDALYHGPSWTPAPDDVFRARVDDATSGPSWVVDGNYSPVRDLTWGRADALVWLDYPRRVAMVRVVRRSVARAVTQEELWNGNREDWRTWTHASHPIRWTWARFPERRATYPRLLVGFPDLDVFRLRRPRDAAALLRAVSVSDGGGSSGSGPLRGCRDRSRRTSPPP
jgi:adenylate kinase family enzyme